MLRNGTRQTSSDASPIGRSSRADAGNSGGDAEALQFLGGVFGAEFFGRVFVDNFRLLLVAHLSQFAEIVAHYDRV